MLDKEVKQRWCAALREPERRQCVCTSRDTDGRFCAFGVLLDILGAKWTVGGHYENGLELMHKLYECGYYSISCNGPIINGMTIVAMNDTYRMGFAKIANEIEKHL